MDDIYEEILRLKSKGECAALATVISTSGSTPREQGAKMLVRQDGSILGTVGGSILEGQVREEAIRVIREGKPKVLHFDLTGKSEDGMICGGNVDVYIEPIIPKATLYLFGGGHISFTLSRLAKLLDYQVVIIDDRKEYANPARFPEADKTIADDYPNTFSQVSVDKFSYIVIVTRGHAHDQTVLEWAITTDAQYIGMIGSRKKIKTIYEHLMTQGVNEDTLKRVHAPIGLDINAETPEEIAVSIIAEIINVRRAGMPRKSSGCPA
ncbi:MAG: XdhC/CoxI family protein [Pseudomonadota bacterium]